MDIIISNSSGVPIYEQIVRQVKGLILSGALREGEALPSMRPGTYISRLSPQNAPMRSWNGMVF